MKLAGFTRSRHVTIALHVLIWGAVLIVPFFHAPREHYGQVGPLKCNFFTLTNILHIGLFYFNAFFLSSRLLTRSHWWLYILTLCGLVIFFYYAKLWLLNTWFPMLAADKAVFQFTFFPTVFFLVSSTIYRLVRDKIDHEKVLAQREAEQMATELKFLRSQVSPHFLFNVLNNLVSMARHKSELLEPSLIKLSELMRYMLYESDERKVPVEAEVEFLKSYIELQKLRFEEYVEISSDIQPKVNSGSIEPMLLIPFVENAFKHGVALVQKPFIRIALDISDNILRFRVENRFGTRGQSKDKNSGIGLINLKARLNLLYPDRHQLSVKQTGDIFRINLSLQLT